jgi:uncharacterized membrane protein
METYLDDITLARIEQAIAVAERTTSAEIRVHIEDECAGHALDRAAFVFTSLKMHETALRNGILIYVSMETRKAAVIGDKGIHEKVDPSYWQELLNEMLISFKQSEHEKGLLVLLEKVGNLLTHHYPVQVDDINELSNKVTNAKDIH